MRYVIIGSSAAGAQAAQDLRALEPQGEITIVSREPGAPYSRCLLPKYVDGRLLKKQLYFKTVNYYQNLGVSAFLGEKVARIERSSRKIETDQGKNFSYDKLLIATGSLPFRPKIEGVGLAGVCTFYSLQDADDVIAAAGRAKEAVIVGAGFVGLEAAYALARLGLKVTVIERCSQILPNQFDVPASQILKEDLESLGVSILLDESVSRIGGEKKVEEIIVGDNRTINCQLVILATGNRANTELASAAGLRVEKGIVVDEYLRTEDPNIFAAGDAIEVDDVSSGRRVPSATWFNAVLQGKYAAVNMAGGRKRYTGAVGIQNAVQFHDIPAVSYGKSIISPEEQDDFSVMSFYNREKKIYKKLILRGEVICGLIFVGDIARAGFYAALIRNRIEVSRLRARLLDSDFTAALFPDENFGEYSPFSSAT